MDLHERDDLLRRARADWSADPGLRQDYRQHRPNIERTVSQVASHGGRRIKLRYRGTVKNNLGGPARSSDTALASGQRRSRLLGSIDAAAGA